MRSFGVPMLIGFEFIKMPAWQTFIFLVVANIYWNLDFEDANGIEILVGESVAPQKIPERIAH